MNLPHDLPELLIWLHIPADFKQQVLAPSPAGTLLSSAAFVAAIGICALVFWPRLKLTKSNSFIKRIFRHLGRLDRNLIYYATYIFGTHYRSWWVRRILVLLVFSTIAIAGALLPWPTCMIAISSGLFGIFIIFRQWSHIDDDKIFFIEHRRKINIQGDLRFEVTTASLFILIFAPVAFAQMQLAEAAFQVDEKAGPFAFEFYTLIEILKIAPLVPYYDLYADVLNFRRLGTISDPTFQAKFAIVVFRASADLVILGVIKRFLDIARRVSAGLDLDPYMQSILESGSESERKAAVDKLATFARENKPMAREYLEDVVRNALHHKFPEVGLRAAKKLVEVFGRHSNKPEGIRILRDVIIDQGDKTLKPHEHDPKYGDFREVKGDAALAWAKYIQQERGYQARLKQAISEYHRALKHYERHGDMQSADRVRSKRADAQKLLDMERDGDIRVKGMLEEDRAEGVNVARPRDGRGDDNAVTLQ
jgi:hypothetical protein